MKVKRYVVDSMPDALQQIRNELGKDAVIINTKEIRTGGFLGMFGKKRIEVVAATDSSAPAAAPSVPPAFPPPAVSLPFRQQAEETRVPPLPKRPDPAAAAFEQRLPYVPDVLTEGETAALTGIPQRNGGRSSGSEETLLEEIRQMKEMVTRLSRRTDSGSPARHPLLERLHSRLLEQEIRPDLAEHIVDCLEAEEREGVEWTEETVRENASALLKERMGGRKGEQISPHTQIVHFVGPTGVGKTTTIAKLAAEQVLKHQRKVGFITSDTYRIAAVEQLKTYATILNVPLEVVFSPQDLHKAFEKLAHCDMIFMDTAGRNFRNEMYVSELNALLQTKGRSETILVLSLTTKYKDMKVIAENFMKFKLDKVLFTKMDETDSYGAVVNLVNDFPLQLSYLTNGQNVPDDIVPADVNRLAELLLEDLS
ncbi:flagellar biosynthesis protein FlhF [Paenibacillus aurantius]|uniref:Flagellar biosynthesis protein FlhF n=1 Tax=Paenibacillus aurantius TaxID=2918900 RepID=A0AA96RFS9_9BACL|nr:flagellar biosynthesis protein FlhF [Paenibacillus aurantius]WNQ13750.1 flagellar biosynthesis protein FlhF [Paenibacillus aurantius]